MNQTNPAALVEYTVDRRVAHIRVDRPKYRNAQSRILLEQLDSRETGHALIGHKQRHGGVAGPELLERRQRLAA